MKIKRVDILGFKSFVDKVSLDFQQPITGVVGPNGCGKSNIVDAIRWAMGEQNARNLRGRAMEDIIFGGSESRKPHGMAEVSIIFDNSAKICPENYREYAEIMITRRLYRNGDSEYLINKTPCRLLDITELFMDTGVGARAYSIIEQGKVGLLVSARPEERRALIEEAAGVTKFKSRKKTAQRKMDATRQNLVRLGDIISEVRRQTGSLKRQAQQAERYRELRGEAKRIEICMAGNRFRVLRDELLKIEAELKEKDGLLVAAEMRLANDELQLEEQRLLLLTTEDDLRFKQEQDLSLGGEIQRVEGEMLLLGRQSEDIQQQSLNMEAEESQLNERLMQVEAEAERSDSASQQIDADLEATLEAVEVQQETLRQRQAAEEELAVGFESARREQMEILSETGRCANRQEEIARRLSSEDERQQRNRREAQSQVEELSAIDQQRVELEQTRENLIEDEAAQREERELLAEQILQLKGAQLSAEDELLEQRQLLEKQRSRLDSLVELEQNLEGYNDGVQQLFAQRPELQQQVVADLLKVDPAYETLIELALGERLQAVAVQDSDQSLGLLDLLSASGARACLAHPVTGVEALSLSFGQPLIDLVSPLDGHDDLLGTLLAGCYLVDDVMLHQGQPLPPGTLLVDTAGRCLGWRGDLAGGATTMAGAGLLRKKREIGELGVQLVELDHQLLIQQQQVQRLQQQRDEHEETLRELDLLLQRQALKQIELQKDHERIDRDQLRSKERLELLNFEAAQLNDERQQLLDEQEDLTRVRQGLEERQLQMQEQATQLQGRLGDARSDLEAVREFLTVLRVRQAEYQQQSESGKTARQRLAANRAEYLQRLSLLGQNRNKGGERIVQINLDQERLRIELGLLIERREAMQEDVRDSRNLFEEKRQALEVLRGDLRSLRTDVEGLRRAVNHRQLRQKELTVEISHVRDAIAEKFNLDLLEHQVAEANDVELERLQLQLRQLQLKISALGDVNLTAIEEFRELEERYEFLHRQREDLNQSLDDLQKAINKINRTTRHRFKETFDRVNEKFQKVFPRLFRGGQAELRLTDEEDLLETGIDIIVQPPGKKLQNVNLLSGGEKALTAVAIIFSLFLIKPTPFCMLDEVDAPLDDANIDRFVEMVAEMSQNSQFIIITHSKRTMGTADIMHGITMQEPGVSKLVSVRVNDYLEETAEAVS